MRADKDMVDKVTVAISASSSWVLRKLTFDSGFDAAWADLVVALVQPEP
jgi:hypothetical protein